MNGNMQSDFLAEDVYGRWKAMVSSATHSMCVFTPYLDRLLVDLIRHSSLPEGDICVVTDLSPASSALTYRGQLLGLRALLTRGVEVRSLSRLHAKVLVIDESAVTVGSQNFTRYAKSSRETTVVPAHSLSGSAFLETLSTWRSESGAVDLELVERLIKALDRELRQLETLGKQLTEAFDQEFTQYNLDKSALERQRERQRAIFERTTRGIARSRRRTPSRMILARLEWVPDQNWWQGSGGGYSTLRPRRQTSTFASWMMRVEPQRQIDLKVQRMYPMIIAATGRLAFVRVNKGQITYFRADVSRGATVVIGDTQIDLSVHLPSQDLDIANVEVVLRVPGGDHAACRVRLLFDGFDVDVVDQVELSDRSSLEVSSLAERVATIVKTDEGVRELLAAALRPFKFARLGIENRNAEDHLQEGLTYRVGLIEFSGVPILAIT